MFAYGAHAHTNSLVIHNFANDFAQWLTASFATAVLVTLSWFNAMQSPVFDCVRAGAQLLRARRDTAPTMQIEAASFSADPISRQIVFTSQNTKE